MAERVRSVEVAITVDTNKDTRTWTLRPEPDEDLVDFVERIRELLERLTDV